MKDKTSKIDTFMRVTGEVVTDGSLIVEGELLGSFDGGELVVENSGRVVGEVRGERIECSGHIEGNVETSSLKLKEGGCQVGTVVTGELEVESGAVIDCVLNSGSAVKVITPCVEQKEIRKEKVDLRKYLSAFSANNRPCCIEVPWSERLDLYNHVQDLLAKNKRLIKIVGEKGSGKTTFAQRLLTDSVAGHEVIELEEKVGSVTTLLKEVAGKIGLKNGIKITSQSELAGHIRDELLRRSATGRKVVLIIDDTEKMFQATMEGVVRLLSGAYGEEEIDTGRCLQIVLLGTTTMKSNMVGTILDYFEDETNCQLTLDPLSMKDTADYLRLGLQLASQGDDATAMSLLSNETIKEVHVRSGGSIAETNTIIDKALERAHSQGKSFISPELIKELSGR